MKKYLLLIIPVSVASGCAGHWQKNREDATNFYEASQVCSQLETTGNRSALLNPDQLGGIQASEYQRLHTARERRNYLETAASDNGFPTKIQMDKYAECMRSNGWSLQD